MSNQPSPFLFKRENFIIAAIGIAMMIIGYFLMSGDTDIYSAAKITVAPLLIVGGFIVEIFAIMYKPKKSE
jgi:preprotein translocase subunit Sss1